MKDKTTKKKNENGSVNALIFKMVVCLFIFCVGDSLHWKELQITGFIAFLAVLLISEAFKKAENTLCVYGLGKIKD